MFLKQIICSTGIRSCLVFFSLNIVLTTRAQSPGGYATGLRFWIKADAAVYVNAGTTLCTNNTLVQQWNDQSGNGFNATQGTSGLRATYLSTGANGNPMVQFGGTHFLDAPSLAMSGTSDYFAFCVVKLTSASAGGASDGAGSYILDRTTPTNELFDIKVVASAGTNRFFFQKRNDGGGNLGGPISSTIIDPNGFQLVSIGRIYNSAGNTLSNIYVNGNLENTQTNGQETTTPPPMRIGRHATNSSGGMVGNLAELIVYNNVPTVANKQKVDSYLAVKYGFSISQSALTNYLSSSGTVIYPATTTHSNYVNTITGIGMDNGSGLSQSSSRNQSSNDFVRMENPSALSDGDFLLWGNNNSTMITPNSIDVDGVIVQTRLSRVWRVAHTGTIGTVLLSVDMSTVPGAKSQTDLVLLIDRNGNGFSDNDVTPLTGTLTGSTFSVAGVNLQDGDFFTVGSKNPGSTPLPIVLKEFSSICKENTVELHWSTASENENSYFVLERSDDGENWIDVQHILAAGNSQVTKHYFASDDFKKGRLRYYRLTQVDFDGNTQTFKVIYASCFDLDAKFNLYPNPTTSELFVDLNLPQNFGEGEIKIMDVWGKICLSQKMYMGQGNTVSSLRLNLEPGLYTVILNAPGLHFPTQKIIVR